MRRTVLITSANRGIGFAIARAFAGMERSGRSVDALINNAGILHENPLLDLSDAEIADSLAVQVTGPTRLIRLTVPTMLKRVMDGS